MRQLASPAQIERLCQSAFFGNGFARALTIPRFVRSLQNDYVAFIPIDPIIGDICIFIANAMAI